MDGDAQYMADFGRRLSSSTLPMQSSPQVDSVGRGGSTGTRVKSLAPSLAYRDSPYPVSSRRESVAAKAKELAFDDPYYFRHQRRKDAGRDKTKRLTEPSEARSVRHKPNFAPRSVPPAEEGASAAQRVLDDCRSLLVDDCSSLAGQSERAKASAGRTTLGRGVSPDWEQRWTPSALVGRGRGMNAVAASTTFGRLQADSMRKDLEDPGNRRKDVVTGWHFDVEPPLERRGSVAMGTDTGWMSNPASPVPLPVGTSVTSKGSTGRSRTGHSSSGANGRRPLSEEQANRLTLSPIAKVGGEQGERRLSHGARPKTSSPRPLEPSVTGSNRSTRAVQHLAKQRSLAGYSEAGKAVSPGNAMTREDGGPVGNDSPEEILRRSCEVTKQLAGLVAARHAPFGQSKGSCVTVPPVGHDEAQLNYKAHKSVSLISEGSRIRHPTDSPRVGKVDQTLRDPNGKVLSPGAATARLLRECGQSAYGGNATKLDQKTGSRVGVPPTEPVPACLDVPGASSVAASSRVPSFARTGANSCAPDSTHQVNEPPVVGANIDSTVPVRSAKGHAPGFKLLHFSGEESDTWTAFFCHIQVVARANEWDSEYTKNAVMASLRGKAMLHLETLPPSDNLTLVQVMTSLQQRFGKTETRETLLAELTARRQKVKETYKDLGNDIRRLVCLAYPTLNESQQNDEMCARFKVAVSHEVVQCDLRCVDVPMTLTEMIARAERRHRAGELTYGERRFNQQQPSTIRLTGDGDLSSAARPPRGEATANSDPFENRLEQLIAQIGNLESRQKASLDQRTCYNCNKKGHISYDCPEPSHREEKEKMKREQRARDKAKSKAQPLTAGSEGAQVPAAIAVTKPGAGAAKPKATPPNSQTAKPNVAHSGNGQ